ncbi:MAG: hypothetical protein EAZ89_18870, partial [Bacteroidetes bacterium]
MLLPLPGVYAQFSKDPYALLLQSGQTSLPENIRSFVQSPALSAEEREAGRFFRLIQFYQIPGESQQAILKRAGVEFLEYIPQKTWLAGIPASMDFQLLADQGVRSVAAFEPGMRIQLALAEARFPDWILEGDRIEVLVRALPHSDMATLSGRLNRSNMQVIDMDGYVRQLILRILPGDLYTLAAIPQVQWVEAAPDPGTPEDTRGKSLHRTNMLNSLYSGGRHYDGTGVSTLVRDDGHVGPHIDFQNRLDQTYASITAGTHGDGVAGILGAAGNLNPSNQGMAPGSFIHVINYQADFLDSTLYLHTQKGVLITNSSYSNGCNVGYTTIAQTVDQQSYLYPTLLHVFSAGNSNGSNCGYGAGNQWGNITGGHKMGKNVIATANVYADDVLETSSSRGPASDGRIKPDITANGQNQISNSPDNAYSAFGGTSGAAPGIAGISAQLYQAFRALNGGQTPEGSLIKAVMMNTADDLGNVGPDFRYGWGRINAFRAVKLLEQGQWLTSAVSDGDFKTHAITVPAGVSELRVMLYWMDPQGSPLSAKALVNDLNLSLDVPAGSTLLPWLLNPAPNATTLNAPAGTGVDDLNNVEQVVVTSPAAGTYQVKINGAAIPQGPQKYYVVYEFVKNEIDVTYPAGGEGFAPGTTERLRWDAYQDISLGGFTLEYTVNGGSTWLPLASVGPNIRQYDWAVPNNVSAQARVRITRGAVSGESFANFSIIGVPAGLVVEQVCPTSTRISWDAVPGAGRYDIFMLGDKYMDSVGTVPAGLNPEYVIEGTDLGVSYWFAVRAAGNNGLRGRRTLAIQRGTTRLNCPIPNDMGIVSAGVSGAVPFQDCRNNSAQVTVKLKNESALALSNIPVFFEVQGSPAISQNYTGTLAPGVPTVFTFSSNISLPQGPGSYPVKVWVGYPGDTVSLNDTANSAIVVYPSVVKSLPYVEDFESFALCSGADSCGAVVCPLPEWINLPNGIDDAIDWRTYSGPTPTPGTGPDQDQKPGTEQGKYLYLEASNCINSEAWLVSPCIDLSGSQSPELRFSYHMAGSNIGELRVDLNINGFWLQNYGGVFTGSQGSDWKTATVSLASFSGQTVSLRFRGRTGTGPLGDIAIDHVAVYDKAEGPVADFVSERLVVCENEVVDFHNFTLNSPTGYQWEVSPALAIFAPGSSVQSAEPQILFPYEGLYTVSLSATNANGNDQIIKTAYIEVDNGEPLDLVEDFQSAFPPASWRLLNPDQGFTWEPAIVTGSNGVSTLAAHMNYYNYDAEDARDVLGTFTLNLEGISKPVLYFDVAYARYNAAYSDSLRVFLAADCGSTFGNKVYEKGGVSLATVADETEEWFPAVAGDWRRDSIDLSAFAGSVIALRFEADNDYGNNLFLDNIQVTEKGPGSPTADFSQPESPACEGAELLFTNQSGG